LSLVPWKTPNPIVNTWLHAASCIFIASSQHWMQFQEQKSFTTTAWRRLKKFRRGTLGPSTTYPCLWLCNSFQATSPSVLYLE
jgi:hypothetical protein